jgi:hypothetical protein
MEVAAAGSAFVIPPDKPPGDPRFANLYASRPEVKATSAARGVGANCSVVP